MSKNVGKVFLSVKNVTERFALPGMMCGILVVDNSFAFEKWPNEIIYLGVENEYFSPEQVKNLRKLFKISTQQLKDEDMNFQLLLPSADTRYSVRVEALVKWCSGFVYGFSVQNIVSAEQLSTRDFTLLEKINQISAGVKVDLVDDNLTMDEEIYPKVVDYLTMGLLLLSDELIAKRPRVEKLH